MTKLLKKGGSLMEHMMTIVDNILQGADSPHVVVGPLSWLPENGVKRWRFIVAVSQGGFACDSIGIAGEMTDERRAQVRSAFLTALTAARRPIVIHDVDDEVAAVRLCEKLWPGDKVRKVREAVETEHESRRGAKH